MSLLLETTNPTSNVEFFSQKNDYFARIVEEISDSEGFISPETTSKLLIHSYKLAVLRRSIFEILDNGQIYAEIPLLHGVWAMGRDEVEAESNLESALTEWIGLKIEDEDRDFPVIGPLNLNVL